MKRPAVRKLFRILLPPLFWLGVWTLAAFLVERWVSGRGNELLLPWPGTVAGRLLELAGEPEFWISIAATLERVAAGMAAGTLAGILLSVLTSASSWAYAVIAPAVRAVRAAPVVSFILLVLLWTGRNRVPAVISALMVMPVIWSSVSQGIRSADPQLLEMASAYRFGRWKTVRLIYVPSVLPGFRSAAASAMGLAWKSGVAAEVLCLPEDSIGFHIYRSRQLLETPDLFAWTAAVVVLSLLLERLFRLVLGRGEETE